METIDLLKHNTVFSCLAEHELNTLLENAQLRHYLKGQYLIHAGDIWPFIFFLIKGTITAAKESLEGRSFIATSFQPGELFWGVSFFDAKLPMPVALKVELQASVLLWSRDQILPAILE